MTAGANCAPGWENYPEKWVRFSSSKRLEAHKVPNSQALANFSNGFVW